MRTKGWLCLVIALALFGSATAHADDLEQARRLVAEAETHYKLGRFREALDLYGRAYELHKTPGFFFNIAQCHFQLKGWERAIFFYESYLREKPDAPNRTTVEQLIREARQHLDEEAAAARAQAERRQKEAERRAEEDRRAAAAEHARLTESGEGRSRPAYKSWWFWAAVGGAVALAAGGAAYYYSGETTPVPPEGSLGLFDLR